MTTYEEESVAELFKRYKKILQNRRRSPLEEPVAGKGANLAQFFEVMAKIAKNGGSGHSFISRPNTAQR